MRRAGYLAVTAAAILWAVGGAYASRLIDDGASFVELTEARAWITALVLVLVQSIRRRKGPPPDVGKAPLGLVVLFGCSIAAANFTYYASLARLPVAIAITIQYSAPGLVALWAAIADRRAPSRRVTLALLGTMAGVGLLAELPVLVREGALRLDGLGLAAAVLSAFAFATYMVTGERLSRVLEAPDSVMRGFLVASAIWLVVQLARGRPDTLLSARFALPIVFLAVATTIAPFMLFVWGLERIRVTDAGIVSTLEPLAAALIAFVWLNQSLSGWQIAGAALVILGVVSIQMDRTPPRSVLVERAAVE